MLKSAGEVLTRGEIRIGAKSVGQGKVALRSGHEKDYGRTTPDGNGFAESLVGFVWQIGVSCGLARANVWEHRGWPGLAITDN